MLTCSDGWESKEVCVRHLLQNDKNEVQDLLEYVVRGRADIEEIEDLQQH